MKILGLKRNERGLKEKRVSMVLSFNGIERRER